MQDNIYKDKYFHRGIEIKRFSRNCIVSWQTMIYLFAIKSKYYLT